MILDNRVNSSDLEIVTFVLVCNTWGSARVTESKPSVKMGHFGVISQCRIDQYVNHLQNLKHLWVEYNQKGACIRCKNDCTMTQCKNLNFTQIDPHHFFQADAGNCVVRLKAYFVRTSHKWAEFSLSNIIFQKEKKKKKNPLLLAQKKADSDPHSGI